MIFYDILESGSDKKPQGWKGILDSVDVSAVRNKLNPSTTDDYCDPVVYYSTADFGSYVPTDNEKDLSDTDRWMTTAPSAVFPGSSSIRFTGNWKRKGR